MDVFSKRDITYTFHLPSTAEDCLGKGGRGRKRMFLTQKAKPHKENLELGLIALVKIPKK